MRQVLWGDMITTACALLALPPQARAAQLVQWTMQAHIADKLRKRLGRVHPKWGDGTLSAALSHAAKCPEPFLSDADYLDTLAIILADLRRRRAAHDKFHHRPWTDRKKRLK